MPLRLLYGPGNAITIRSSNTYRTPAPRQRTYEGEHFLDTIRLPPLSAAID